MTSDYKYAVLVIAEDLAAQEFGEDREFSTLPEADQSRLYDEGLEIWRERQQARAEWEEERRMERAYGH